MPVQDQHRGEHLILYDGVCGLCNRVTAFVLPRDTRHAFDFASLQSDVGRAMAHQFGRNADELDTFYIIANYRTSSPALRDKANAALFLVKALGAPWAWLSVIGVLPLGWLNRAYDFVARHRYGWFGRDEICRIPSVPYQDRFIDLPKT
jgi:predicted DCC family thiol-disulfide oxidoreductase YuxK